MNESDVEMTVPAETGETRAIHGSEAAPQIDPITSKAQLQDVITAIPSPTKVLSLFHSGQLKVGAKASSVILLTFSEIGPRIVIHAISVASLKPWKLRKSR